MQTGLKLAPQEPTLGIPSPRLISIEYQGNAVALKLLPSLGKFGKSARNFGYTWTSFVAIFTMVVAYGMITDSGQNDDGLFGLLILIPFWLVGLCLILGSYRSARKTEILILSADGLKLLEAPFFGQNLSNAPWLTLLGFRLVHPEQYQ